MIRRTSHVRLTLGKELRETLRDRRTLAVMILLPLVIYPLLSLGLGQVIAAREKEREAQVAKVAVSGSGHVADELRRRVIERPKLFYLDQHGTAADVETGRLDALIEASERPTVGTAKVHLVYDAARDESRNAAEKLSEALSRVLPDGCAPRFELQRKDLASRTRLGGYVLSKALPIVIILMVLLGAFYPAIDVTAGERERGTLETVLSAPIARFDLLLGKVLAVALIASITGLVNLASMSATMIHAVRMAAPEVPLPIPWTRVAASTMVIFPTALLFASLFVAIGSVARGFKEAQNLLMPIYSLFVIPALVGTVGEYPLSNGLALVPALNVTLLARELVIGQLHPLGAMLAILSTLAYAALALALAARVYTSDYFLEPRRRTKANEAISAPSAGGDPGRDFPTAGEALALFAVAFLIFYFGFIPWQRRDLTSGLLAAQWGGMLGLCALLARMTGRSLRRMVALVPPSPRALLGAALIGSSAWAGVAILTDWLIPVPKELVEQMRRTFVDQGRSLPATLFLVAVTPAICEEVLFRGAILRGLLTRLTPLWSVLLTGLLFGIFHLDVYRLLPTAILGVLLSWIALQTGSVVPTMVAHLLNNTILVTLATARLDERLGDLGTSASVALLAASLLLVGLGIRILRRGEPARGM